MSVTVTRIYTFEAAHSLPEGYGCSSRLHGHTYTVRVTVPGGTPTEALDALFDGTLRPDLDHELLNDAFEDTTVEGLAAAIFDRFEEFDPIAVEVQEGNLRFARAEA